MKNLYVIEARDSAGQLLLGCPQPEEFFGLGAISGMSDWAMSRRIFQSLPDTTLEGGNILNWPKLINPNWIARRKTW